MGCQECFCDRRRVYDFRGLPEPIVDVYGADSQSRRPRRIRTEKTEPLRLHDMDRREAIQQIGLLLGGTVISAELLSSCTSTVKDTSTLVGSEHIPLLNEIGETILPTTEKSPGAKAAGIGSFMLLMIQDCYRPENQQAFYAGSREIDQARNNKYGKHFMHLDAAQREEFFIELDKEQEEYMRKKK